MYPNEPVAVTQSRIDSIVKNFQDKVKLMTEKEIERLAYIAYPFEYSDDYNPFEDDNKEYRDIWIEGFKAAMNKSFDKEFDKEVFNILPTSEEKKGRDSSYSDRVTTWWNNESYWEQVAHLYKEFTKDYIEKTIVTFKHIELIYNKHIEKQG